MTQRNELWSRWPLPTYPVKEYFGNADEEEQAALTRLFVENRYMGFFSAVNRQIELELFFVQWKSPSSPEEIMGNILITFYRDEAVHFTIHLFGPGGFLFEEKKFTLTFGKRASQEDLPYLAALVKTGGLHINLFTPTEEGVDILARYSLNMDEKSLDELYSILEGNPESNRGELLYASDVFEKRPFPSHIPAYEILPGKNIKPEDIISSNKKQCKEGMIFSGVRDGKNYLLTDIPCPSELEEIRPEKDASLNSYLYNLDFILEKGILYRVYNDSKMAVHHKYEHYKKGRYDMVEMLDMIQQVNITHENNKMDYQIMKEAFLTEKDPVKKAFFATDLLLFPFFRDMGPVLDYLLSFDSGTFFLKQTARRLTGEYRDIFDHYTENFQPRSSRQSYRLEQLVRYVLLYQTLDRLLLLSKQDLGDQRESLQDTATSAFVEYHYEFLEELFNADETAAEKVLSLITVNSYRKLFRELMETGKMTFQEGELKSMDVKEALAQGLKNAPTRKIGDQLMTLLQNLFYEDKEE
jgi:hypothetical protein